MQKITNTREVYDIQKLNEPVVREISEKLFGEEIKTNYTQEDMVKLKIYGKISKH